MSAHAHLHARPGPVAAPAPTGLRKLGTGDRVLPIAPCSRNIVRHLHAAEYEVVFDEFDGGHEIPPAVAQFAVNWFLDQTE